MKKAVVFLGILMGIIGSMSHIKADDVLMVNDITAPEFEPVQVMVHLENSDTAVQSFGFHLVYDSGVLTYQEFAPGALTAGFDLLDVQETVAGDLEITGDDTTGIPAGQADSLIILTFMAGTGFSGLTLTDPAGDLVGFAFSDGSFTSCIPEVTWLSRSLPYTCAAGVAFNMEYSYEGGTADIIRVTETLPAGWTVISPPWDDLVGTSYTWYQSLTYCRVLPPADGVTGDYVISGETTSTHWCNGDANHAITGDQVIHMEGVEPTATPVCLNTGDVNFDGSLTAEDAQITFSIALGMISPGFEESCAADCNGEEPVTAGDAQGVFMAALGGPGCADPIPTPLPTFTPGPTATPTPMDTPTPTPPGNHCIAGHIHEFPDFCSGYQRGWTIILEPLGYSVTSDLDSGYFIFSGIPDGEYQLVADPGCNPFGCWPAVNVTVAGANLMDIHLCSKPR